MQSFVKVIVYKNEYNINWVWVSLFQQEALQNESNRYGSVLKHKQHTCIMINRITQCNELKCIRSKAIARQQ